MYTVYARKHGAIGFPTVEVKSECVGRIMNFIHEQNLEYLTLDREEVDYTLIEKSFDI